MAVTGLEELFQIKNMLLCEMVLPLLSECKPSNNVINLMKVAMDRNAITIIKSRPSTHKVINIMSESNQLSRGKVSQTSGIMLVESCRHKQLRNVKLP